MSVRIPGGGILMRSRGEQVFNLRVQVPATLRGNPTTADFEDVEVVIDYSRERRDYHHSPSEVNDKINEIAVNREIVEANLRHYRDEGYVFYETVEQIMQRAEKMARREFE